MPTKLTSVGRRRIAQAGLTLLLVVSVTACGSSSKHPSTRASTAGSGAGGRASVNLAAARRLVAPYTGHTEPFPVSQPLGKPLPAGTRYALLQCSTPVCGLFAQIFAGAAKVAGVQLTIVKAGASVASQQAAMGTIINEKPSGVILPGVSGDTTVAQVHRLDQMGIPVVSEGVIRASQYGIKWDDTSNPGASVLSGRLMAAWLILQHRASTKAVFYNTPELTFSAYEQQGFDSEITSLCPSCSVRNTNVPVADFANTAPSLVVSDLQTHPQTNSVAFASEEAATGLPSALKVANLNPTVTGFAPPPAVLGYIKAGQIASGLATDLPTGSFETVDVLNRLVLHEPLVGAENNGPAIDEFLEQNSINFNVADGWTGYPDFAQRFAKLWHPSAG